MTFPKRVFLLAVLFTAGVSLSLYKHTSKQPIPSSPATVPSIIPSLTTPPAEAAINVDAFPQQVEQGLPGTQAQLFPLPGATGTAIIIPQIHRAPGSAIQDPQNDVAVVAQNQIADIVPFVSHYFSTPLVMVEGDPVGPVSDAYLQSVKTKGRAIQTLERERDALAAEMKQDNLNPSLVQAALGRIDQADQAARRELLLEGGTYMDVARGYPLTVVGAENPDTQQKAADVVRQYVYVQDRLAQVQQHVTTASANDPSNGALSILQTLLSARPSNSDAVFTVVAQSASNDAAVQNTLHSVQTSLTTLEQPLPPHLVLEQQPPSRADNPYASFSSVAKLTQEEKRIEADIQTVVVDQRNRETADAFAAALQTNRQSYGMIQFGAGHLSGLIQELHARGLSVIVVTPAEVAQQDAETLAS